MPKFQFGKLERDEDIKAGDFYFFVHEKFEDLSKLKEGYRDFSGKSLNLVTFRSGSFLAHSPFDLQNQRSFVYGGGFCTHFPLKNAVSFRNRLLYEIVEIRLGSNLGQYVFGDKRDNTVINLLRAYGTEILRTPQQAFLRISGLDGDLQEVLFEILDENATRNS